MGAGYFKLMSKPGEWITVTVKATDLKSGSSKVEPGSVIENLEFRAGFKGEEKRVKLYIDDISVNP